MEPKEKSKNGKVLAISQGLQVKIDKDLKWKSSLTRYSGEEDKPAESHQRSKHQTNLQVLTANQTFPMYFRSQSKKNQ